MLLYSPFFLFFIPGLIACLIGIETMILLYFGKFSLWGVQLYVHPMFLSSVSIIIGYQLIIFSVFAKSYAMNHLNEKDEKFEKLYQWVTIEKASSIGIILAGSGIIIYWIIFYMWMQSGFDNLNEIKNAILALTLIVIGLQTIFSSFMLSILGIREK